MTMLSWLRQVRESFAARIIVILILTMVVVAVVFDYLFIRMQQETYLTHVVNDGTALSRMLARSVRLGMFSEDPDELHEQTAAVLTRDDITAVLLFTPDGELLFERYKDGAGDRAKVELTRGLEQEMTQAGYAWQETGDTFIFWNPVFFRVAEASEDLYFSFEEDKVRDTEPEREIVGYSALVLSKEMFKVETHRIIIRTGMAVAAFLAVAIAAVIAVINRMTKPLRTLVKRVKADGKGTGGDDIEFLLETYGSLLGDLEAAFVTINAYKDSLEDKVADRTRELQERSESLEASNQRLNMTLKQLSATQDQLIQSEKMAAMGRLVAGVAHEINNTVNFVSGALPSLKRSLGEVRQVVEYYGQLDGLEGAELAAELAEIERCKRELDLDDVLDSIELLIANIEEGTGRTTRIVRDLRVFSHNGAEEWERADLHEILEKSLSFINKDLAEGITVKKEYGDIPAVFCQQGRLSQVFINILTNGMQAMKSGGTITVSTRLEGDRVHVSFRDTGSGIAEGDKARIFDPFFTTKEVGKGSGLGLGISYSIVGQHGGEIKVESEEGRGTVFVVILPVGDR